MDVRHGSARYETAPSSNNQEGWSALELHVERNGSRKYVARVVYWDADGQFTLELVVPELPLRIVEMLINEAKGTIRTA